MSEGVKEKSLKEKYTQDALVLLKILRYIYKLKEYKSKVTLKKLTDNEYKDLCSFAIIQISELQGYLTVTTLNEIPCLVSEDVLGLRERIVYDYDGVTKEEVDHLVSILISDKSCTAMQGRAVCCSKYYELP